MYSANNYLFSYQSTYTYDLLLTKWVAKVKIDLNSLEVHQQLSHKVHPEDGALVGAGWPH
jgi:hypothetical protein